MRRELSPRGAQREFEWQRTLTWNDVVGPSRDEGREVAEVVLAQDRGRVVIAATEPQRQKFDWGPRTMANRRNPGVALALSRRAAHVLVTVQRGNVEGAIKVMRRLRDETGLTKLLKSGSRGRKAMAAGRRREEVILSRR